MLYCIYLGVAASVEATLLAASEWHSVACTRPARHNTNLNFPADSSSPACDAQSHLLGIPQHVMWVATSQAWSCHCCSKAACQGPHASSTSGTEELPHQYVLVFLGTIHCGDSA